MRYLGSLAPEHLHAVARLAIVAAELDLPAADHARELALLNSRGEQAWQVLRDSEPGVVAAVANAAATTHGRAAQSPAVRMPLLLGLGWRQCEEFDAALGRPTDPQAAVLSGCFNAAITLYDVLLDERDDDSAALVTPEMVAALFADPSGMAGRLDAAASHTEDPTLLLYLTLMAACARRGAVLRDRRRDRVAWDRLAALVRELYASQTGRAASSTDEAERPGLDARQAALPSVITWAIAALGATEPAPEPAPGPSPVASAADEVLGQELAEDFGEILAIVDDVADLADDLAAGWHTLLTEPPALPPGLVGDGDLYDAIGHGIGRIAAALRRIEEVGGRVGADVTGLVRLARAMVMAWTGWPGTHAEPAAPATEPGVGPMARAVAALLRAHERDYAEATHWLRLPRADWRYETHPAVVAQRAVICCALLDAREVAVPVPRPVLARDLFALLRSRHRQVRGGWNYVPSVPELPPDADDLGQVVQALVRYDHAEGPLLARGADEAVRMLLDAQDPDGGVPTWLVDPRGLGAGDAAVRDYLPVMGGWGVHTEVVANAAEALRLYRREWHADRVAAMTDFLLQAQEPDGSWASRWYLGPYYGTYKVAAVVAAEAPAHPAGERALAFLRAGQREDGWGLAGRSPDALSTALAVGALAALARETDLPALARGVGQLLAWQDEDGLWPAEPWIVFGTMAGEEAFGCPAITTAYALSALAAAVRRMGYAELPRLRDPEVTNR